MGIKEIRAKTGMTQKDFSAQYRIPLQTLKQWESNPESASFRTPPDYLIHMLKRLVEYDYDVHISDTIGRTDALIRHAEESKYNTKQWLRYLRKTFNNDKAMITKRELNHLLRSSNLTMCQKLILKRAMTSGTPTNEYVIRLNNHADTPMLKEIIREHRNNG